MITISSLIGRSNDEALVGKFPDVNIVLKQFCNPKTRGFIYHLNISTIDHHNRSCLPLNKGGTSVLAQNFINYLRVDCSTNVGYLYFCSNTRLLLPKSNHQ